MTIPEAGRRPLTGRVAVVTGGSRGIGRAIAERYARDGAVLVLSARRAPALEAAVSDLCQAGATALAVVADASDRDDAGAPVRAAVEAWGHIDILVNNVGGGTKGNHDPFTTEDDAFERTVEQTLLSAWWASRAALPHMRNQGYGRIINIGSAASRHAGASPAYVTAKHGIVGLTKALAERSAQYGITVNCLCPGWTNTPAVDFEAQGRARGITAEQARAQAESENLQRRVLEPEELGGMASLLASAEGAGITGQVINVDGGFRV